MAKTINFSAEQYDNLLFVLKQRDYFLMSAIDGKVRDKFPLTKEQELALLDEQNKIDALLNLLKSV